MALVGSSINLGARLLKAVPPGSISVTSELVATLEVEAPSLARGFGLIDTAYEIPGAGGLRIAVHAIAGEEIRQQRTSVWPRHLLTIARHTLPADIADKATMRGSCSAPRFACGG